MLHSTSHKKGKEGLAAIWIMLIIMAMVMFLGLVVDTGFLVLVRQKLQTAADSAALAGVYVVRSDPEAARNNATAYTLLNTSAAIYVYLEPNTSNAFDGDIVIGQFDGDTATFTPTLLAPNALQVNVRRTAASQNGPITHLFGDLLGITNSDVSASAIAQVRGGLGAGVIALNSTDACAFDVRGTGNDSGFTVNDGVIYVNSSNTEAVCHAGQPTIDAAELYAVGGTDKKFEDQTEFTGEIIDAEEPIADPLADLPDPYYDVNNDLGTVKATNGDVLNLVPGYYSGGIENLGGTLNLSPGVYILDGEGLEINGGTFNAPGSMFYIVDTTPGDQFDSNVDIAGNGITNMSAPDMYAYTYSGVPDIVPYSESGVTIFQARENTNFSRILGDAGFNLSGTIYMPNNTIGISGTSENLANGLIADKIELRGNGLMNINYDGRYGVLPANVFLVQ